MNIQWVNEIASWLLPLVLDVAVKGAALLLVVATVTLAMRRASASARQLVWFMGMTGLLVLPVLTMTLPAWRVLPQWPQASLPPAPQAAAEPAAPASAVADAQRAMASPVAHELPITASVDGTDEPMATVVPPGDATAVTSGPAAAPEPAEMVLPPVTTMQAQSTAPSPHWLWALAPWAMIAWASGTAVCLVPLVLSHLALRRLERRARRVADPHRLAMLDAACSPLGLRRKVILLESTARAMPMLWGILTPRLLVPAEFASWSPQRQRVVLLHELAHARRRDGLMQLIAMLACAWYWFNPLSWWALKRLQAEAERACDDLVLSTGHRASDYAEDLLHIASGLTAGTLAAYSSIAMARTSKLEGRLLAILDETRNRRCVARRVAFVAAVLLAGVLIPLAAVSCTTGRSADEPSGGEGRLSPNDDSATTKPVSLGQLDLTDVPVSVDSANVPDLFEERPPGSRSWELRKTVEVRYRGLDGAIYFVPHKKVFYVQRDPWASNTLHFYGPIVGQRAAGIQQMLKLRQAPDDHELTLPATQPTTGQAEVDRLIKQIGSDDAKNRNEAQDALAAALTKAVGGKWEKDLHQAFSVEMTIIRGRIDSAPGKALVMYGIFPLGPVDRSRVYKICASQSGRILGENEWVVVTESSRGDASAPSAKLMKVLNLNPPNGADTQPATQPAAVQRVIRNWNNRDNSGLSLETGRLHSRPAFRPTPDDRLPEQRWWRENHVDLRVMSVGYTTGATGPGFMLEGLDMVSIPADAKLWQASDVDIDLQANKASKDTTDAHSGGDAGDLGSVMSPKGRLPAYYAFRTRSGRLGILQIAKYDKTTGDVTVSYRLLPKGATQGDREPTSAPAAATQPVTSRPATQPAVSRAEIARLVEQLASDDAAKRQAAQEALVKIGEPTIEPLRGVTRAAGDGPFPERQRLAADALTKIIKAPEGTPPLRLTVVLNRQTFMPTEGIYATVIFSTEGNSKISLGSTWLEASGDGLTVEVTGPDGRVRKFVGVLAAGVLVQQSVAKGSPLAYTHMLNRSYDRLTEPGEYQLVARFSDRRNGHNVASPVYRFSVAKVEKEDVISARAVLHRGGPAGDRYELVKYKHDGKAIYLLRQAPINPTLDRIIPIGRRINVPGLEEGEIAEDPVFVESAYGWKIALPKGRTLLATFPGDDSGREVAWGIISREAKELTFKQLVPKYSPLAVEVAEGTRYELTAWGAPMRIITTATTSRPAGQAGGVSWRDEESDRYIGMTSQKLVSLIGTATLHSSAEPAEKFSDKDELLGRGSPPGRVQVVGHFYEKLRPDATLVVRVRVHTDEVFDAYWCTPGKSGSAFFSPPPRAKGTAASGPATSAPASSQPATQKAAVDDLIQQLGSESASQRAAAQAALIKTGQPAMAALRAASADKDVERAAGAKAALERIEEEIAGESLRRTATLFESNRRVWAKDATDWAGIDRLVVQLGSEKVAERAAALDALVKKGLPAVEPLRLAATHANANLAAGAQTALERLALRKEHWPVNWRGMTFSYRQLTPDPAKCMVLYVAQDRQALWVAWDEARREFVTRDVMLPQEDVDILHRSLGKKQLWTLSPLAAPLRHRDARLDVTITVDQRFTHVQRPWPSMELAGLENVVSHLLDSMRKTEAMKPEPADAHPAATAAAVAKLVAAASREGKPPPAGELHGEAAAAAQNASGAADLARSAYEQKYDSAGPRSPANKADPATPEGQKAFAAVEKLYQEAIAKAGYSDMAVYVRQRLAGAYQYRGMKAQAEAMNTEAAEMKSTVARLKEQHRSRREGADWPELAELLRLLHRPESGMISRDELAAAWAKLGKRSDEAVGRVMEGFWTESDYAYRWRALRALGVLESPRSRQVLLEMALGTKQDDLPWIRGAAREYVETLTDMSEARRLLVSKDEAVLQHAAIGLNGVAIDKEMLPRLLELMKSSDAHLRFLVVSVLANDPGGKFAAEKVAAIVGAIPDIPKMKNADEQAEGNSWTNAEHHLHTYTLALAQIRNAAKPLADAMAKAKAGDVTWRCLVVARAQHGDPNVLPLVRKMLVDADAGLFRAWAADAMGRIGNAQDLPLLREVAQKDQMERKVGGDQAPMSEQLYHPVRQAAEQAIKRLQPTATSKASHPMTQPADSVTTQPATQPADLPSLAP